MPRKKKSAQPKMYFTQEHEDAIVQYNRTDDPFIRERLFVELIHPAFDKLAENIINRFKFPYIPGTYEQVKAQVVSYLVINLHKYSPEKGSKAFSYFSVIAKNYLILHNNSSYKEEKRTVYIQDASDTSYSQEELISEDFDEQQEDVKEFIPLMIKFWDHNLTRIFKKRRDQDIANAVIELFKRIDGVENFNKKNLYLLIREMTNHKTVAITKVVNKMKVYVLEQMKEFRSTGTIEMGHSKYFKY